MAKKFTERNGLNLFEVNKEVLNEWDQADLFHKSMSEREGYPSFVFYEGPPSANGHPGIHHVMARTIKDVFCRYKTMKGFHVNRKAGWDTHGLPVELSVEKELGITKEDIGKTISIEDYNSKCRKNVMMYTQEWTDLSHLMGYWVDMEHPYIRAIPSSLIRRRRARACRATSLISRDVTVMSRTPRLRCSSL